jgi:hypothetical protein
MPKGSVGHSTKALENQAGDTLEREQVLDSQILEDSTKLKVPKAREARLKTAGDGDRAKAQPSKGADLADGLESGIIKGAVGT